MHREGKKWREQKLGRLITALQSTVDFDTCNYTFIALCIMFLIDITSFCHRSYAPLRTAQQDKGQKVCKGKLEVFEVVPKSVQNTVTAESTSRVRDLLPPLFFFFSPLRLSVRRCDLIQQRVRRDRHPILFPSSFSTKCKCFVLLVR